MNLPSWWTLDPAESFLLGPRNFPGRIWTASGCFAYGLTAHDVTAADFDSPYQGIGAVVTKTVTPQPRTGNPMPRLAETWHGAINSIGLENVGFEEFLTRTLPDLEARGVPTVVSLAATRPEEFGVMVERLYRTAASFVHWHGVELPATMDGSHISQNPVLPGEYFRCRSDSKHLSKKSFTRSYSARRPRLENGLISR